MDLAKIQAALREAKLDGWLFYDHHRRDAIAYRVLGIAPVMCTRRWYYLIPAEGEPVDVVELDAERGPADAATFQLPLALSAVALPDFPHHRGGDVAGA